MLALQVEIRAALALLNKNLDVRGTLHYNTTSQNLIDGEWSSIILSFSDDQEFVLLSIFFAFENRLQSYSPKPMNNFLTVIKRYQISAGSLWEKTDTLMRCSNV